MKHTYFPGILSIVLVLALPSLASANTQSFQTTASFLSHDNTYYSTDGAGGNVYLDAADIDGLSRFDPAQGNLDNISISLMASLDVWAVLTGTGSSLNGSAEVTGLSNYNFELVVWDSSNGNGYSASMGLPGVFDFDSLACTGDGSDCFDEQFAIVTLDGFADITGIANRSDFIGTGALDPGAITFGVSYPETLTFTGEGYVDVNIVDVFADIQVTLIYEFTPVPLPGAFWLLASGTGLLVGLGRRRKS